MTVSNTLTFDQTPPFRPGVDDLGGTAKENNPKFLPIPGVMPSAEEDNQKTQQIAALARMAPLATLTIVFVAGTPTIVNVKAMGTSILAGSFTVVDNGAGDTTIWWDTPNVLPPTSGRPKATVADIDANCTIGAEYTTVLISSNSKPAVHVKTRAAGVLTDAAFVVDIM